MAGSPLLKEYLLWRPAAHMNGRPAKRLLAHMHEPASDVAGGLRVPYDYRGLLAES
jgi:hypothetical protein